MEDPATISEFKGRIAQQRIVVNVTGGKENAFIVYEDGPDDKDPIIFLPPAFCDAPCYYRQVMFLASHGFRVLTIGYPSVDNIDEILELFCILIIHFRFKQVHLFGCGVGGLIAQLYAQKTAGINRVASLILCNSFDEPPGLAPYGLDSRFANLMPRRIIEKQLASLTENLSKIDDLHCKSVNLVNHLRKRMSDHEFYSHLKISHKKECNFQSEKLQSIPVTILQSDESCFVPDARLHRLTLLYPNAKIANMNSTGPYPFLTKYFEVNAFILIHLKQFYDVPEEAWSCKTKLDL